MSDFLLDFINSADENTPNSSSSRSSGISFLDNVQKTPTIQLPTAARSKSNPNGLNAQFLKTDDTIRVKFKTRGQSDEEITVPRLKKTVNVFFNKSIIFYGPTQSGKTTLIKDFMYIVRKVFPAVFVFSPTNLEKGDYNKIVPYPLIYEDFRLQDIQNFYQRQRAAANMYNIVNNMTVLEKLFNRIASPDAIDYVKRLQLYRQKALKEYNTRYANDINTKNAKVEELESVFNNRMRQHYKKIIEPRIKRLEGANLDDNERNALKFINFNAHVLAVFDDATDEILGLLKEGKKKKRGESESKNEETIKSFFFKGRWAFITHWYAFHDDAGLDPGIRKNAFYSIFTSKSTALSFFNKSANGFSAIQKKRAEAVINAVFDETIAPPFAKLVFCRLENSFYYVVADVHPDFQMCSRATRAFCEKITRRETGIDPSNPFFSKFSGGGNHDSNI